MSKLQLFVIIFVLLNIHCVFSAKSKQNFNFTNVDCSTSRKTVVPGYECFIKANTNGLSLLNFNISFNRPLMKVMVSYMIKKVVRL